MSRRLIRILVVLSVLSIIGILLVQAIWLRNAYALRERQFRQSAFIALQEVANEVARQNQFTLKRYAVTQLSADYFIVNTDAPINPNSLEVLIDQSLQRHKLFTDYEYGIYDCETDQMMYGAYVSLSSSTHQSRNLPKFPRYTYYFGIRFPSQSGFIAGQLTGLFWSTGAVLLLVIFFGYTLVIVLKQRRLTEIQRDFINNITHELQTPVATIRIAADVLASDTISQQPARLNQYAQIVSQESQRLQRQIHAVLQLARSRRQGLTMALTHVDLHELMTVAAQRYAPHVRLDLQAPDAHIQTDRYHLETTLNNLIDNALKYCTEQPCVTLATRQDKTGLVWSVRDNGIGIAPAHQKAVFQQFFRVPSGRTQQASGFGLGLYYVRQVISAHGWHIRLVSTPGLGSTFSVYQQAPAGSRFFRLSV
ncbi:HAMP domain-containing sensor histidine kinase [uncultured Spirosoma sp.]|uniref:sensor histidine kinase n=1 Tax=uncultured Spirosoma sp. TaxID=278208 RepID=UPI00258C5297|nr:HAMP domain-containing sensor histidine kinase [uncultured Spirosoma sp.]